MKFNILILPLLLLLSYTSAQTNKTFIIEEHHRENALEEGKKLLVENKIPVFYEDEDYLVSASCSGEWGGSIRFKNKKTGVERSAASTCPVTINKLDGKYYLTNTLAHMSGFSEILEIADPEKLQVFNLPKPIKKKGKMLMRYVGDDESKSTAGTRRLIDTMGVITLASFPFRGQLFHVVSDFKKLYLVKTENYKYNTIEIISNSPIWTYDPKVVITKENHRIVVFDKSQSEGYLDIFENRINVVLNKIE
ncbi:hypothetical protein [Desertivirga arenae]|uniref:hypothetical protein n=1 Tax=Desertivirga arenae TaxID=2810309 RepID=UPI001A95F6E5|nr:hypothetical protein [Pedobacter sp. SYSU D00823]